jgi:hypothetical protein
MYTALGAGAVVVHMDKPHITQPDRVFLTALLHRIPTPTLPSPI